MEFSIDRDIFLKSLSRANGIIEKKTTYLPKNIKTKTSTPNDKINNGISRSVRNP